MQEKQEKLLQESEQQIKTFRSSILITSDDFIGGAVHVVDRAKLLEQAANDPITKIRVQNAVDI